MLARAPLAFLAATANLVSAIPFLGARHGLCEPMERICYGQTGGTPQNLDMGDIRQAAHFLRLYGRGNNALWSMPVATGCEEWTIEVPGSGSLLVLARHVEAHIKSSVSYEDIADTIDGGQDADPANRAKSLLGCGAGGGSMGVRVDNNSPLYKTAEYGNSGAEPRDIIIKLVRKPS